jgi:regulatory Fis family protein
MGVPPLSEAEWDRTLKALKDADGNQVEAAASLGIPRTTLQSRVAKAIAQKRLADVPLDGFRVKGTSTLHDADGNIKATWVKTDRDAPSVEEISSQVSEALKDYKPPASVKTALRGDRDLATVYPLADWHIGLLSWSDETGHNYDLKIAKQTIETAMQRLVASVPQSKQAVILGLGDLLHSDNFDNQTAKSKNVLDVDGRYPKILYAATQLLLFTIDLALQKHESVLVVIKPGNHDEHSAVAVRLALSLHYQDHKKVSVCDSASRFWWWEFGSVLLGATHGDKAKMKDLPLIMAARNPEAWGKTKFRHIMTGHIHTQTGIEMNGVTVESFQTPVAPDAWHTDMGYGANRSIQAITYHKTDGEIMRQKVNIV